MLNISIDEPIYNSNFDKSTCLKNILSDEKIDIVGDCEKKELSKFVMEIVDELDEEDKKIITLYFGLNQNESYTQKEIAHIFNTRQSTIGKKISRILNSMKERIVNGKEIKKNYCPEWLTMYKLAKAYYENNKNLEVSQCFKTKNGYEYDEDGAPLGRWIENQRVVYKNNKLTEDRKKLLEEIGMVFDVIQEKWDAKYELAKIYYEFHGNLQINRGFKTKNGYEYDEDGIALGEWLKSQKSLYFKGKLDDERKNKLDSIEMNFEKIRKYTK